MSGAMRSVAHRMRRTGHWWLALAPVLAVLASPWVANTPGTQLLGMPRLLGWLVVWLVATSAILAIILQLDKRRGLIDPDETGFSDTASAHNSATSPLEQWALGGRRFGPWLVFVLLAGEIYTTFTLLGASGWAYGRGAPTFYIIGYGALGYLLSYWLLPAVWRRGREWRVMTQPEFFSHAFGSPAFGRFVAVIGVLALFPYLVLQLRGLGILVHESAYHTVTPGMAMILGTVIMVLYVVNSGMRGSAYAAVAKDALILAAVVALGILVPNMVFGGIGPMFDTLMAREPAFFVLPERGSSPSWFISTVLVSVAGFYLWPHTFASLFAARSASGFRRSAVYMPLYQLVLLFVFFVGFAARDVVPGLTGPDIDLALLRTTRTLFGPLMMALVGAAGLLTALVPSAIILMTMATIIVRLRTQQRTTETGAESDARNARWLVPILAVVALIWSWRAQDTLVTMLLLAYAIVAQLAPALALALLAPSRIRPAFIVSGILLGETVVAVFAMPGNTVASLFPTWPATLQDINVGVLALSVNIAVLVCGTLVPHSHMRKSD
ncbi:MAG: DUF3311 domain-containing protein [Gemmatimonadaceae bacterium]|nr:DUF3311 domain-containing protein [Gemmatimonadaceae bacterium]